MNRGELLEKIAVFPITARGLAEDLRNGAYRSVFRGNGIEFDEARDFRAGDDVRAIDRNVSARFGRPFVKLYREEREFSLCVILDCSISMMEKDASGRSRFETALLAFSLLGFSAEKAGQRFGAVFFDNSVKSAWTCRQGLPHLFSMVGAAVEIGESFDAQNWNVNKNAAEQRGTALSEALRRVFVLCKQRSLIVVISDFFAEGWEAELPRLCVSHDCVCLRPELPVEKDFSFMPALFAIEDLESGKTIRAASTAALKEEWKLFFEKRNEKWEKTCARAGAAYLVLPAEQDIETRLSRFFGTRRKI